MALLALAAAVVGTACGDTITGRATPGMTPVELSQLDAGLFPTEPSAFEMEVTTDSDVYSLEARRMLGFLISPHDVDPELRYLNETQLVARGTSPSLLPEEFAPISDRNYLIAGAVTSRVNNDPRRAMDGLVALLRFGNDDYARTAATEYNTAADQRSPGREKLVIAGHDKARAGRAPTRDHAQAFAAKGSYVVAASFTAPADQADRMTDWLKTLFDLQFAAMKDLTPTPPDDILDLPTDPEGVMSTTLPAQYPGSAAYNGLAGAYPPAAHIHFENDADQIADYTRYRVDLVARNEATVYRTASTEHAFALQARLSRPAEYDEEIPGPPGIADARCIQRAVSSVMSERFYCVLVYERYVAVVDSYGLGDLPAPELYQAAAAQYSVLANSRAPG
ncbi:DUF7373 family lipoprotein [Nocardia jinanensis]|uniref:DUF7373 family lipoprotein n=1 Tax=Nocardia jinanensis TaxID=382504 RepID=UPI0007A3FD6C|nr:hypothetical protein [Nocardia jinanensis]